jgi:hypothetical protein
MAGLWWTIFSAELYSAAENSMPMHKLDHRARWRWLHRPSRDADWTQLRPGAI